MNILNVEPSDTLTKDEQAAAESTEQEQLLTEVVQLLGIDADKLRLLDSSTLRQLLTNVSKKIETGQARRSASIVSVVPWDLISPPFIHNNQIVYYAIPASVNHEPQYLRVYDTTTTIMDLHHDDENTAPGYELRPVPAEAIVDNLLRYWAGDHFANAKGQYIGVMRIAGHRGTPTEITQVRQVMRGFFTWMVEHASRLYQTERTRPLISQDHHRAYRELSKYPDIRMDIDRYPWARTGQEITASKPCVWCNLKIDLGAIFCQHCRMNQIEYYVQFNIAPPADDHRLTELYNMMLRTRALGAPESSKPVIVSGAGISVAPAMEMGQSMGQPVESPSPSPSPSLMASLNMAEPTFPTGAAGKDRKK